MLGGIYPGQMYPAGIPVFAPQGATTVIGEPPIRIRNVTSRAANAANVSGDSGTIRHNTRGSGTLRNVEQSD